MIYSQLLQVFNTAALFRSAFLVALIFGLGPMVMSNNAYAQGNAELAQQATVNINTADAQSLAAGLKGVGQSRALDIIRYRETYGAFTSVDELAEVKGVGKSTIEKNRHVLTLE
jgi:competence protein ComEA